MLKDTFLSLLSNYSNNNSLHNILWEEIAHNYSNEQRYYHTLEHLESLLVQLTEVKDKINHWDTILFTLFYHDVIYNSLKSTNEEKSADLAVKRMQQLHVPKPIIEDCKNQILATKTHKLSEDSDTNYFIDTDLSVLGKSWEIYSQYYKNVRKEYAIYPNLIYNPGRKKALTHFLDMDKIFKTEYFYQKFEKTARENIQREIELL
ncbi:HD domain-containing protein [Tenacibaculum sp.]|uniref:HD domain-containing protein n=1 Tax=Tenacibaculum sp. TaxID=1906242 RepID=UPI003D113299